MIPDAKKQEALSGIKASRRGREKVLFVVFFVCSMFLSVCIVCFFSSRDKVHLFGIFWESIMVYLCFFGVVVCALRDNK